MHRARLLALALFLFAAVYPTHAQTFVRGDADASASTDLGDSAFLLDYFYGSGPAPLVQSAADANDNGAVEISDVVYLVNYTELGGPRPPQPFPFAGADPTSSGFEPPVELAVALELTSADVFVGESGVSLPLLAHNGLALGALEVALAYDSELLTVDSWDQAGSALVTAGAEFIAHGFGNAPGDGHAWFAAVLDSDSPFDGHTLPPGAAQVLANLVVSISPSIYRPQSARILFRERDQDPPRRTLIVVSGEARVPVLLDSTLRVLQPFIRGDANGDQIIDISDVIYLLGFVFNSGPAPDCDDAADANDDTAIDIADAVLVLGFLFSNGPDPLPPYPDPGTDPTADSLDCHGPVPLIDVWYGTHQQAGQHGMPQVWVDVLGRVSDPGSVTALTYQLNGGPLQPLSLGPDDRRLASEGDFVVELPRSALANGTNLLTIHADSASVDVTVDYTSGNTWPSPYTIDWNQVTRIDDAAHVVDGLWRVENGFARVVDPGYDRLLGLGDISWTDYEVTAEVIIQGIEPVYTGSSTPGPLVGFLPRWQGHYVNGAQPNWGFLPFGMVGAYQFRENGTHRLEMRGDNGLVASDSSGFTMAFGVVYFMKMRVESTPTQGGHYQLKAWPAGLLEPAPWTISAFGGPSDLAAGSLLLVAHQLTASFGRVEVTPLP